MTDRTGDTDNDGSGNSSVPEARQGSDEMLIPAPNNLEADLNQIWADRVATSFQHGRKIVAILTEVVETTDNFISVVKALDYMYEGEWDGLIFMQGERLEAATYPDRVLFRSGGTLIHLLEIIIESMEQLRGASRAESISELNAALAEFLTLNHQAVHCFPDSRQELEDNILRFNLNTA